MKYGCLTLLTLFDKPFQLHAFRRHALGPADQGEDAGLQRCPPDTQFVALLPFGRGQAVAAPECHLVEQSAGEIGFQGRPARQQFRYLHFATHGQTNNVRAFDSALILTKPAKLPEPRAGEPYLDGRLTAAEVLEYWQLDADLVTLSACESGLGRQGGGDGLLGFAQAFLLAGSRSVCLSLWQVDDTPTALLMDRFYRNLLGKREDGAKPLGKAAALRGVIEPSGGRQGGGVSVEGEGSPEERGTVWVCQDLPLRPGERPGQIVLQPVPVEATHEPRRFAVGYGPEAGQDRADPSPH
jgi:hypothetical protein